MIVVYNISKRDDRFVEFVNASNEVKEIANYASIEHLKCRKCCYRLLRASSKEMFGGQYARYENTREDVEHIVGRAGVALQVS